MVPVFISSTFRDMHAERDWLAGVVFPELQERLRPYRIRVQPIDLRWGVTQAQAERSGVLSVLLDHIDRCRPDAGDRRPFFIGLLGERYGHVPETFSAKLLGQYPWLNAHRGHSLTALEIVYAISHHRPEPGQCFFYFRDPAFMADVHPDIRAEFLVAENPQEREPLQRLKQRILSSGLPVFQDYPCVWKGVSIDAALMAGIFTEAELATLTDAAPDGMVPPSAWVELDGTLRNKVLRNGGVALSGLETFGVRVLDDLWNGIALQFPEIKRPLPLEPHEQETFLHESFAADHLDGAIGRDDLLGDIRQYIRLGVRQPFLVTGPAGSGKTTVLAQIADEWARPDEQEAVVIAHFIGASPGSTSLANALPRIAGRIRHTVGIERQEYGQVSALPQLLAEALNAVPEGRLAILIIDGLDQLDDLDRKLGLYWLPSELPARARLILSVASDEQGAPIIAELEARDVTPHEIPELTATEREQITAVVPSLVARTLDADQRERLLRNPATGTPLYLRVALDELRWFGSHDLLTDRIAKLAEARNPLELFAQVLARLELAFGRSLVAHVTAHLAASRAGLTEGEIAELLPESMSADMARALVRQLRPYLRRRAALHDFGPESLRQAVRHRYWEGQTDQMWHLSLAAYFGSRLLGRRTLEELPWQLARAGQWQKLREYLSEPTVFQAAWRANPLDVQRFWADLMLQDPSVEPAEAYRPVLEAEPVDEAALRAVTELLMAMGQWGDLHPMLEVLATHYADSEDARGHAAMLDHEGLEYRATGRWQLALDRHRQAEPIWRNLDDEDCLQRNLGNQGNALFLLGRPDEALRLQRDKERISRRIPNLDGLQAALGDQAAVLRALGRFDEALDRLGEQEQMARDLRQMRSLVANLTSQADLLRELERFAEASTKLEEAKTLCDVTGNGEDLLACLMTEGNLRWAQAGQSQGHQDAADVRLHAKAALDLYARAMELAQKLTSPMQLAQAAGNAAMVCTHLGRYRQAAGLHEVEERTFRALPYAAGLAKCLLNQAILALRLGDAAEASRLADEAEAIAAEHGLRAPMADSLAQVRRYIRHQGGEDDHPPHDRASR